MYFFFFKQKTAYEMRISDWSSDVCASDLLALVASAIASGARAQAGAQTVAQTVAQTGAGTVDVEIVFAVDASRSIDADEPALQRPGYAAALTHPDVRSAERREGNEGGRTCCSPGAPRTTKKKKKQQ